MWDTQPQRHKRRNLNTNVIQKKGSVRKSRKVTEYDKRHLKKAGEYSGQNVVSIATNMSIAVWNV